MTQEDFSPRRRRLIAAGAGLAAAAAVAGRGALAEQAPATGGADGQADFLFVQTAGGIAWDPDRSRLTLKDVSPVTVFFTDRPERIAGNMNTAKFVPFWSEGSDSFLSDPPNADLSIVDGDKLVQVVVELRQPELDGTDLSYTVRIIDGELPPTAGAASLFIDVIGMPLTPLSYAGVARRSFRRAALY